MGLGHVPLNNVEIVGEGDVTVFGELVESPALALRDASGSLVRVGATPTMFPVYFLVDDGLGGYLDGATDLAPDDIAGISFLYPRGSQDKFFTISEEARTQTRSGFPSLPLPGAHVVAWCDADNDAATARVPLFSTITGLYEYQPLLGGQFRLYSMYKSLETAYGETFAADYTFTVSPINGLSFERQAPFGYDASEFDYIDGGVDEYYAPIFPSETFHETGNILDLSNREVGTPLSFDETRQLVVSVDTGKSLATMLAGMQPMFGQTDPVCPYNIIIGGLAVPKTSGLLRGIRDRLLLSTALGTAAAEAYYKVSPAMARSLVAHPALVSAARVALRGVEWSLLNYRSVSAAIVGGLLVCFAVRRRKRTVSVAAILGLVCLASAPAYGLIANLSEDDMVAQSDYIVTGTVEAVDSSWEKMGSRQRIVTDVTIQVVSSVKGHLNKNGVISLRVLGGRVGSIISRASDLPMFKKDEQVLLYLTYSDEAGYVVLAGARGKYEILTESDTGEKYVVGGSVPAQVALDGVAKKGDGDGRVTLDAFTRYLRDIVKEQEKKRK